MEKLALKAIISTHPKESVFGAIGRSGIPVMEKVNLYNVVQKLYEEKGSIDSIPMSKETEKKLADILKPIMEMSGQTFQRKRDLKEYSLRHIDGFNPFKDDDKFYSEANKTMEALTAGYPEFSVSVRESWLTYSGKPYHDSIEMLTSLAEELGMVMSDEELAELPGKKFENFGKVYEALKKLKPTDKEGIRKYLGEILDENATLLMYGYVTGEYPGEYKPEYKQKVIDTVLSDMNGSAAKIMLGGVFESKSLKSKILPGENNLFTLLDLFEFRYSPSSIFIREGLDGSVYMVKNIDDGSIKAIKLFDKTPGGSVKVNEGKDISKALMLLDKLIEDGEDLDDVTFQMVVNAVNLIHAGKQDKAAENIQKVLDGEMADEDTRLTLQNALNNI
jgi:hypothetical protein